MKKSTVLLLASFALNDVMSMRVPVQQENFQKNERVMALVKQGMDNIKCCEGKDVIMVIGITQTGKSTLINYLFGSRYRTETRREREEREEKGDYTKKELIWCTDSEPEIATVGIGDGFSVTDLPKGYEKSGIPFVFLDTRGFYNVPDPNQDTKEVEIHEIASSVLVDLAVKNAKSVRMLTLQSYGEIQRGMSTLSRTNDVLKKIFTSNSLPVLFLYNRYSPQDEEDRDEFRELLREGEQSEVQDFAKKDILRAVNGVFKRCNMSEVPVSFRDRVANVVKDNVYGRNDGDMVFIECLRKNLEAGRFAYFDPKLSQAHRKIVNSLLASQPVADKKYINLTEHSKEMRSFKRIFEADCINLDNVLSSVEKYKKYSVSLLEALIKEYVEEINAKTALKQSLEKSKKNEATYLKLFAVPENKVVLDESLANERIQALQKEIRDIKNDISEKGNEDVEIFHENPWEIEAGLFTTVKGRSRTVEYNCKSDEVDSISKVECEVGEYVTKTESGGVGYDYYKLSAVPQSWKTCSGEVKLFAKYKNTEEGKTFIKQRNEEVRSKERKIASEEEQKQERLEKAEARAKEERSMKLLDKVEANINALTARKDLLSDLIRKKADAERSYEEKMKEIEVCIDIARQLRVINPGITAFVNHYERVKGIEEIETIPNIKDPRYGHYIVDGVRIVCDCNGKKPYVLEYKLAKNVLDSNSCSVCKKQGIEFSSFLSEDLERFINDVKNIVNN